MKPIQLESVAAAVMLALAVIPAGASGQASNLAVPQGESYSSPALGLHTESFGLPQSLREAFFTTTIGHRFEIAEFPVRPGVRQRLELERRRLYAPGARVVAVEGGEEREVPRHPGLYFVGTSPDDPSLLVGLLVDPGSGVLRGLARSDAGTFELVAPDAAAESPRHLVRKAEITLNADEDRLTANCGTEEVPVVVEPPVSLSPSLPVFSSPILKATPALEAVIAVDTDNEFNHKKFGNSTADATAWIAELFVQLNVMYERDLSLRLLQGQTFLRRDLDPSPTYDDDPYNVSGSGASGAHLNEFGNHWASNHGSVDRVLAMMLSGKSASSFSSSGIAWLDGFCENSGGGYSFTQVFWSPFVSVLNDTRVVGHELGHNFGSPHTHCYSPPVDHCYSQQSGCYNGSAGLSCPAGGKGTTMSYCHFSNGANCGSNLIEFHPTVVNLLNNYISAHTPWCVKPLSASNGLFSDGFESGSTSAWD